MPPGVYMLNSLRIQLSRTIADQGRGRGEPGGYTVAQLTEKFPFLAQWTRFDNEAQYLADELSALETIAREKHCCGRNEKAIKKRDQSGTTDKSQTVDAIHLSQATRDLELDKESALLAARIEATSMLRPPRPIVPNVVSVRASMTNSTYLASRVSPSPQLSHDLPTPSTDTSETKAKP